MPIAKNKSNRSISERLIDTDYEAKLIKIRAVVEEEWGEFDKIDNKNLYPFPSHDHQHCASTEEMLDELILGSYKDDKEVQEIVNKKLDKLEPVEVFLLIAVTWLHDIGMQPKLLNEDKDKDFSDPKSAQRRFQEVRSEHAQRSAKFIDENIDKLKLDDLQPEYINILKAMCEVHGHRAHQELYQLKWLDDSDSVRIQLLIAYQRLADALHIHKKPDSIKFKKFLSLGIDTVSRFHWLRSKYAMEIECDPENFAINVILKRPRPRQRKKENINIKPLVELIRQTLRDELDSVKEILSKGGLSFYSTINCDSKEISMHIEDRTELNQLLTNLQLYDTTMTPSARSVIDNVFQQIDIFTRGARSSVLAEEAVKYLNSYLNKPLKNILEKRPCYVFLRKVFILLDTILGLDQTDAEKVKLIRRTIKEWRIKRDKAIRQIPKIAYGILADSAPVLVYGFSSTVAKCLAYYLQHSKKKIDVYICEARTKTIYRFNNKLYHSDCIRYAEELSKVQKSVAKIIGVDEEKSDIKIEITILPDACASNLFSMGKISKVLLGANGISMAGRVGHTLGHLAIADMAAVYNVPVFILANSMKIGFFEEKPELPRENPWLTTDLEFEPKVAKWKSCNPREDVLPPEKISAIITEKGIVKPTEIIEHADTEWLKGLSDLK